MVDGEALAFRLVDIEKSAICPGSAGVVDSIESTGLSIGEVSLRRFVFSETSERQSIVSAEEGHPLVRRSSFRRETHVSF